MTTKTLNNLIDINTDIISVGNIYLNSSDDSISGVSTLTCDTITATDLNFVNLNVSNLDVNVSANFDCDVYVEGLQGTQGTFNEIFGTLMTPSQPNITSVGSLTSLNVSGGIQGTIMTPQQENITSVGTLTSLNVSGGIQGNQGYFVNGIQGVMTTSNQPFINNLSSLIVRSYDYIKSTIY